MTDTRTVIRKLLTEANWTDYGHTGGLAWALVNGRIVTQKDRVFRKSKWVLDYPYDTGDSFHEWATEEMEANFHGRLDPEKKVITLSSARQLYGTGPGRREFKLTRIASMLRAKWPGNDVMYFPTYEKGVVIEDTRTVIRKLLTEAEQPPLGERLKFLYRLELKHAKLKAHPDAAVRQDVQGRANRLEAEATPVMRGIAFDLSSVYDSYIFDLENEFPDIEGFDPEDPDNEEGTENYEEVQMILDRVRPIAEDLNAMSRGHWAPPFGEMVVLLHKALTTAHHSGVMLDYVAEEHPDVTKELLDRLSAGEGFE